MNTTAATLTVAEILEGLNTNRFLMIKHVDGTTYAVRSAIELRLIRKRGKSGEDLTAVAGFYGCNFHTYISHKPQLWNRDIDHSGRSAVVTFHQAVFSSLRS